MYVFLPECLHMSVIVYVFVCSCIMCDMVKIRASLCVNMCMYVCVCLSLYVCYINLLVLHYCLCFVVFTEGIEVRGI